MTRNIVLATLLALGATAANADNNYTFDDGYWKRAESVQSNAAAAQSESQGKYDLVDRYNP